MAPADAVLVFREDPAVVVAGADAAAEFEDGVLGEEAGGAAAVTETTAADDVTVVGVYGASVFVTSTV
jgi:hypothetical protein